MDHTQDVTVTIVNPIGIVAPPTWEDQYYDKRTDFTFSGHLGFSGTINIITYTYGINTTTWGWELRATVTVNNGHGATQTSTVTVGSGTSTAYYVDASATYAGSFSASVGTDKLWDIAEAAFSSTSAPTQFPSQTSYTWYERSTVGSTATCSLSVGGSTVTATNTVSSTRQTANYKATLSATGFCTGPQTHDFGVTNIKVNGTTVPDISHAQTKGLQDATEWSLSLKGDADAFGIYRTGSGTISTTVCLARSVNMFGRIRAWEGAYPNNVDVVISGYDGGSRTVTASSGSWSGNDSFNDYSAYTTLTDMTAGSGTLTTALNDVPTWISAALSGSSLTTNGDNSTDTRVMFRGWRFTGWSVAETNNRSISGTGNDRTYAPYEGMSGYRYLDVQVKAQSGTSVPGTIELTDYHGNTKSWNVTAATTSYATITLDLCSPDSHSLASMPDKDAKDNPYSRKNTSSTSYAGSESVDSAYWGVTSCQRLRVSSGAIDIGTTTLKYTNTDSTYVPDTPTAAFERITPAIVAEAGTTTYYYGRRFWQQDRDGRNEEESDVHWQMTVGGATGVTTYSVSMLTIAGLASQVNASDNSIVRHPGWVMTRSVAQPGGGTCAASQPPLRDCYLNGDTGLATWLYGGGALLTPNATSGTDFAYGHQITSGTITAQTVFDRINGNFPPDLYDPFDINGGTDSALYLGGVSLLRGIAHGGLLDTSGDIVTTGTVDLIKTSDASNRGTDSTIDAQGRYYTSTPWGLGEVNHHVDYLTKSQNINPIHTSHRHRVWFRDVLQEVYSAIEAFKNKGLLMLGKATKINVRWQDNPLTDRIPGTVITSDNIVKLRDSDYTGDFIYILIKGSTSYTLSYTTDNGATKGDYLTVTAGTAGFEADTNRGILILIYDDGTTATPGNIKYRISRDLGDTWSTAANCTINSVSPQAGKVLDTSYDPRLGGMLYAIFDIGGTKKVCRSTDSGVTWEVVLT
jgi:hypothetical protein